MNRKRRIIILSIFLFLNTIPIFAQNDPPLKLSGKITREYRSNFFRLPDPLKVDDNRTNLFLNADYQQKVWNNARLEFVYELRYHNYDEYHHYDRHDHLGQIKFQKPIKGNFKLHLSNEFRSRFSSTRRYSYFRNIFDVYVNLPITLNDRAYVGFQNWNKTYPKTSEFNRYISNRLYSKFNLQLTRMTRLGLKLEFQFHEGDLYPGSTTPTLEYELAGERYVFQANVDNMFNRKLFTSFVYRFENDMAGEIENKLTGEHLEDENTEDLLAEDSDFGYLKNQGSLSALFKLNSRISVMVFYLVYQKNFRYWYIEPNGSRRRDRLIFLSHILKINLFKSIALEIQHNSEDNHTNLKFYEYTMNSVSAGLSVQY